MKKDMQDRISGEYEKLTEDELAGLGIVLGAYRSFRGNRRAHIAYVSMPITSGLRFYETLRAHRVKSAKALAKKAGKDAMWSEVIKPNLAEGVALADSLGLRQDLLFIAPSVFEAKRWRWSQNAYMSLWYRVIGEMAGSHYLMDGWQYSSGSIWEVVLSMHMQWRIFGSGNLHKMSQWFGLKNFLPGLTPEQERRELEAMWRIRVYDQRGRELRIDDIMEKMVEAYSDLERWGMSTQSLGCAAAVLLDVPKITPLGPEPERFGVPRATQRFWQARRRLEEVFFFRRR